MRLANLYEINLMLALLSYIDDLHDNYQTRKLADILDLVFKKKWTTCSKYDNHSRLNGQHN